MTTFVLIFSLLTLSLICLAVFRRRLFLRPKSENENFRLAPPAASLFAPTDEEIRAFKEAETEKLRLERREEIKLNLIERAKKSDFGVLVEAEKIGDSEIYRDLLDFLIERNKVEPSKFERLIDFVSQNDLSASETAAKIALTLWAKDSSAISLSRVLHVSALTDSAEIYLNAVEAALDFRRAKTERVSDANLIALVESHFHLLSSGAKSSGAGFMIKEKLASARREVSGK